MLKWIAILGVFFNSLLLPAAEVTTADAGPVVSTVTWDKEFRPIYPEAASYPRATPLSDGRVMVAFAHPTSVGKAIACVFSSDGGKTWAGYRRICEHPTPVDLDNAFPLQLADGSMLVAYRRHDRKDQVFRIEVSSSRDGSEWSVRSTVATGTQGIWEPFLLALPDGTVQAYYASEEGCYPDQRIEMRASTDGGMSWGTPMTVAEKKGSRDGMPGVARLNELELLVVFEAQDEPPFRFVIRGVRSSDLGRTWSTTRQLIYRPNNLVAAPWAAGAPSIIRLPDGRLMVSFQSDENNALVAGDPRRDPRHSKYDYLWHTHLAYVTSVDQGQSWMAPVHLLGGPDDPANWNALQVLNAGPVLALSNHRARIWVKAGTTDGTPVTTDGCPTP
jgi:hypothetical protein